MATYESKAKARKANHKKALAKYTQTLEEMGRTAFGHQLEFISWIQRDGNGTISMEGQNMKHLYSKKFNMNCLSITNGTWIASEFNSFVVKFKTPTP